MCPRDVEPLSSLVRHRATGSQAAGARPGPERASTGSPGGRAADGPAPSRDAGNTPPRPSRETELAPSPGGALDRETGLRPMRGVAEVGEIDVQEPWFTLIAQGTKSVEGRLRRGRYKELKGGPPLPPCHARTFSLGGAAVLTGYPLGDSTAVGDVVSWKNEQFGFKRTCTTRISRVHVFPSFAAMLSSPGGGGGTMLEKALPLGGVPEVRDRREARGPAGGTRAAARVCVRRSHRVLPVRDAPPLDGPAGHRGAGGQNLPGVLLGTGRGRARGRRAAAGAPRRRRGGQTNHGDRGRRRGTRAMTPPRTRSVTTQIQRGRASVGGVPSTGAHGAPNPRVAPGASGRRRREGERWGAARVQAQVERFKIAALAPAPAPGSAASGRIWDSSMVGRGGRPWPRLLPGNGGVEITPEKRVHGQGWSAVPSPCPRDQGSKLPRAAPPQPKIESNYSSTMSSE